MNGRVLDSASHPVPDALVTVVAGPLPFPEIALVTDADGRFTVALSPGWWTLRAHGEAGAGEATHRVGGPVDEEFVIAIQR